MNNLAIVFVFLFGSAVGSFLNAYIYRLGEKKSVFRGRSFCPFCKNTICAKDLIPILSFILLKGKCRFCRKKISWQYPLVEASAGILFALGYMRFLGDPFTTPTALLDFLLFLSFILYTAIFIVIFVYDLKYYLILDKITVPAFFIALGFAVAFSALDYGGYSSPLKIFFSHIGAAIIGGGFFLAQFFISQGRWIGGGDIRLGALMGMMLGIKGLLIALFLSYVGGSLIGLGLVFSRRKKLQSQVPFAVFLAPSALAVYLYGDILLDLYVRVISFNI